MKDKTLRLTIMQFNMVGAIHWYVTSDESDHYRIQKKFIEYKDARKYALNRAYAKNITVYE